MTFDFLSGTIPPGEHLAEFDTYTPTLTATTTNPNLGADGSATGWWHRIGRRLVVGEARILFSGTGVAAGSGTYLISLPLPANLSIMAGSSGLGSASMLGGSAVLRDNAPSLTAVIGEPMLWAGGTQLWIRHTSGTVTEASPWTWATGDRISVNFMYLISPGV